MSNSMSQRTRIYDYFERLTKVCSPFLRACGFQLRGYNRGLIESSLGGPLQRRRLVLIDGGATTYLRSLRWPRELDASCRSGRTLAGDFCAVVFVRSCSVSAAIGLLLMNTRLLCVIVITCLTTPPAWAQTFIPTSGNQFWNVNGNWTGGTYPDSPGTSATLPSPTDPLNPLTIDLGEEITIGSLTVNKSATVGQTVDVTLTGSTTNKLVFEGGGTLNNNAGSGTGLTTISAPVVLKNTLTATQSDTSALQFTQEISEMAGSFGLNLTRAGSGGAVTRTVVLGAANSYTGPTILTGSTGSTNQNFLLVRLDDAESIPTASNITMTNAVLLGLAAADFTRTIGTGAGAFQNVSAGGTGWAALARIEPSISTAMEERCSGERPPAPIRRSDSIWASWLSVMPPPIRWLISRTR